MTAARKGKAGRRYGLASLGALLALAGCTFSTLAYPVFQKSGMEARGPERIGVLRRAPRGDETYTALGRSPFEARRALPAIPNFCIQLLPAAPPMATDALTPEFASHWLARWSPSAEDRARGVTEGMYPGQAVFTGNGCILAFDQRTARLAWILIGETDLGALPPAEMAPRVGPADCGHLYAFPLGRAQLLEILGEPEWEGWTRGPENLGILL